MLGLGERPFASHGGGAQVLQKISKRQGFLPTLREPYPFPHCRLVCKSGLGVGASAGLAVEEQRQEPGVRDRLSCSR